jgi:hypothetical protein
MKKYNNTFNSILKQYSSNIFEEMFDYVPEDIKKAVIDKGAYLNVEYSFIINEKEYQVDFMIQKQAKSVKFSFALISETDENPLGITGTGDSHLVFGAVANIFKRFVDEYSNRFNKITFIGSKKDKNRTRLYDRFCKTSWMKSNFDIDIEDDNDVKYYTLIKKNYDDTDNIQNQRNMDV